MLGEVLLVPDESEIYSTVICYHDKVRYEFSYQLNHESSIGCRRSNIVGFNE